MPAYFATRVTTLKAIWVIPPYDYLHALEPAFEPYRGPGETRGEFWVAQASALLAPRVFDPSPSCSRRICVGLQGPSPPVGPLLHLHPIEFDRVSINLSPDLSTSEGPKRGEGWTFAPDPETFASGASGGNGRIPNTFCSFLSLKLKSWS